MNFKDVYKICLLVFVCIVSANRVSGVSGNDIAGIRSDIINFVDNVLHQTGQCTSDADCHHLGKCQTRDGGKLCDCKKGTSGDFCETVDECADNPERCGTRDDVSCVFDVVQEKVDCKCDNDSKTYVPNRRKCISPCTTNRPCSQYGYCMLRVGEHTFCGCEIGTSGDFCEIINDCDNKHVDCGVDNNATCLPDADGSAYCECADKKLGFDYQEKVCKNCDGCGKHIRSGCEYTDGIRRCYCKSRYYSSDEGVCEDCKCGINSYGCEFENGTKICQCWGDYQSNGEVCEKCDCGSDGATCEFKDGKKVCTCKEGYMKSGRDGICTQMCNATIPCENGGTCSRNVCSCLKGTGGKLCKTIDDCRGSGKCGGADCLYNVTSQKAYCKCSNTRLVFDDLTRSCKVCDCGTYQRSCSYEQGRKKCKCMDAYEDRGGECTLCFCKGYSSMYGCHFDGWRMVCNCLKGFAQQGDECKKCDCGDHGKCSLFGWGSKSCTCDEGYVESIPVFGYENTCVECNCGKNGRCYFENRKKICSCENGYKEYQGTCKACDCGYNAECKFNEYGGNECVCHSGYGMNNGICKVCNCYPGTSCTFGIGINNDKECICPEKYANDRGSCADCDCGLEESNCTLNYGIMKCQCPKGYEAVNTQYNFYKSSCKDIDECLKSYTCPSTTNCVNTPGSYDCVCKEGYEKPSTTYDIKKVGCLDIDECVRDWSSPCNDPYAKCVNTPGSYRCDCREGFSVSKAYNENYNICIQDSRPWRTATIVVGCLSAVVIVGLLIGICHRHI